MNHQVDVSQVDIGKLGSETIEDSTIERQVDAVKNHISPRIADHTSPASPCSTKSADDNGEQKLSTPGAASSGYGSAVLTQTTSSDDLLGDHAGSDDINGEQNSTGPSNSRLVTAEVNIIDAAVPSDLDSPLKPTTPYADEPTTVPSVSNDAFTLDSAASNSDVVVYSKPAVDGSNLLEHSTVSSGAISSNPQSSANVDSGTVDEAGDRISDVAKFDGECGTDNSVAESLSDSRHATESVTELPSDVSQLTSCVGRVDEDAGSDDDLLPQPHSADRSSITVRSTPGSVKTSYRPVSMPPEMTIVEDERMDITKLGMHHLLVL